MDSSSEGAVLDSVKSSKLSMEKRRDIVYELAKWPQGAPEILQTWSRQDILQILCAEMGKERKYTGLTKLKIIEHLLKVVSEKISGDHESKVCETQSSPSVSQKSSKRSRKPENPSRLLVSASATTMPTCNTDKDSATATYCKNAACKAKLNTEDVFCKRCTCCVCHKYDDNKDPSLWLTCSSEPPFPGDSCNISCHLECALKHKSAGIASDGLVAQLDGSFYCISCGKMNDLMRCWRKQVMVAKETRRVDILCYRISLSQKLLSGTRKYQELSEIVDDAVRVLEAEVGTLSGGPVKMGRGIVNRLSSGQEVQRRCASALEAFDLSTCHTPSHQDSKTMSPSIIRVEDISATSVSVKLGPDSPTSESNIGYTLWHHKADGEKEGAQPTCTLFPPRTRFIISGLSPATEYIIRVVSFDEAKELSSCEVQMTTNISSSNGVTKNSAVERIHSPATNWSSLSNPSSVEDETTNTTFCDLSENKTEDYFDYYKTSKKTDTKSSNEPLNSTNNSRDQNPSCGSDEEHATGKLGSLDQSDAVKLEPRLSPDGQTGDAVSTDNGSIELEKSGELLLSFGRPETSLPPTPLRKESLKDGITKKGGSKSSSKAKDNGLGKEEHGGSSSKKRRLQTQDEERVADECVADAPAGNLKYYVKVIRWLECEGHIDATFRRTFLTWYSIRATPQETRIVKAFVDTLIDDPGSLSEQLVDTFGDMVSSPSSSDIPHGFCLRLWH